MSKKITTESPAVSTGATVAEDPSSYLFSLVMDTFVQADGELCPHYLAEAVAAKLNPADLVVLFQVALESHVFSIVAPYLDEGTDLDDET